MLLSASLPALADITYVDAREGASGNTYATGGALDDTGWLNLTAGPNAVEDQWTKRDLGNDGTILQGFHNGDQLPELTTEITGLDDGSYDVWVFFWDGPNANTWTISAGLSSGALTTYSHDGPGDTASPVAAGTLDFTNNPMVFEDPRVLYGVKLGQAAVTAGSAIEVFINNLVGGGSNTRTWYDGVGYAIASDDPDPGDPDPPAVGPRLFGIDFNRDDVLASPSQSLFRVISGSAIQEGNAASYTKTIGARQVTVTQPGGSPFEFRGANGDGTRAIPGGDISRSFLIADFIATREGAIDLEITNLEAGDYVFRSHHLDTFTGNGLGFAQGSSTTTPNTIQARIAGVARIGGEPWAEIQPTALGPSGLGTTFIDDSQIPTLAFGFSHDGSSPLVIELRSTQPNRIGNHLLLNGFEIFQSAP